MDLNGLLKLGRRQIDEAICGNSANAMAKVILGPDRGEELVQTLNAHRGQRLDRPGEGCVVGRSASELHEALKIAAEGGQRAVALVHLGDSHRFLVEVQPGLAQSRLAGRREAPVQSAHEDCFDGLLEHQELVGHENFTL